MLYSALAVWMLGLAVPVTASYIIAAVMVAPALVQSGVPDFAAHMFIFYYAVLSEVSPPTALSPFAAAAITGGNPFKTMMLTWKYTLPAFLVPFVFTLRRKAPGSCCRRRLADVVLSTATAAAGVAALAGGLRRLASAARQQVRKASLVIAGACFLMRARRTGRRCRDAWPGAICYLTSGRRQAGSSMDGLNLSVLQVARGF